MNVRDLPIYKPTIIEARDHADVGALAAEFFMATLADRPAPIAVLPTGNTPGPFYKRLVEDHGLDPLWRRLTYLQLDEYGDDSRGFSEWVANALLDPVGQSPDRRWTFNDCSNPEAAAHRMSAFVRDNVPQIDLVVLGLGEDGHVGFVMPGAPWDTLAMTQKISQQTHDAQQVYEQNEGRETPLMNVTLGVEALRRAQKTLLIVSGEKKRGALDAALNGVVNEGLPASYLQKQPNVTVIADTAALRY